MASEESAWSIAVKTVGGKNAGQEEREDFTVTVNPEDDLVVLNKEIELVTGLKVSQQRLVYRGRLISGGGHTRNEATDKNEPKVRDIVGLGDGQTIHLVPRPAESPESNSAENGQPASTDDNAASSGSSSSGGSLLAALLGLGSGSGSAEDDENTDESTSARRLRNERTNRRRPHYRLTESDHVVPDPGTMEPVRQGLMTLHTILDAPPTDTPWQANRRWYRGQWIDCRDTVNQWLEATVMEIVCPDDILTERIRPDDTRQRATAPETDNAVSAHDFEGRRQLLLESDGEGGFRERSNNDGVQLLLVHYNGWPQRWDEWIRSDSERIRPFRTRTRHPPSATSALPTPQSSVDAAPSTNIKEENDEGDRAALLPELSRAVSAVNDALVQAVSTPSHSPEESMNVPEHAQLPWRAGSERMFPSAWQQQNGQSSTNSESEPHYSRRQLEALAPLLDRLGRTLIDAAPHVASLASTLPEDGSTLDTARNSGTASAGESEEEAPSTPEQSRPSITGGGLFSLLSRSRTDVTEPSTATVPVDNNNSEEDDLEPDYVDFVNGFVNTTRGDARGRRGSADDAASLLGAYLALSSLVGEGSSDGNGGGMQGLGRLLLARGTNGGGEEGGGGGGIDIHIHAIVTGPGVGPPPGALGMPLMGGGPPPVATPVAPATTATTTSTRGLFSGRRGGGTNDSSRAASTSTTSDEDMGIFADLYSENPDPLDHHGSSSRPVQDDDAATAAIFEDALAESDDDVFTDSPTRSIRTNNEGRSPSRLSSFSSQRSGRSGESPRRNSTIGRIFRRAMGRRSSSQNNRDSDVSE